MSEPRHGESRHLALVLGGGGARAAYQVGILRYLAKQRPHLHFPIITGVSAGAINVAHLASHSGDFRESLEDLVTLWRRLTVEQVFRTDFFSSLGMVLRWGLRLVSGGSRLVPPTRGLVDTRPLGHFLRNALQLSGEELSGVQKNLERGTLEAAAITTTNYGTGQSITWVQGQQPSLWRRPHRLGISCQFTLSHVLASTSLPLFFPAVQVGSEWHGDGGIRLTAPLSPALHLGAQRILALSTRYPRTHLEADRASVRGYPPPAQVAGLLMNAIFLDMLDYDATTLERISSLLTQLPTEKRNGLRPVKMLILRPSQDLGKLAANFEPQLPRPFRYLARGLGSREVKSQDFLSMLLFQPQFLARLMEIGEADAEARGEELLGFVDGTP